MIRVCKGNAVLDVFRLIAASPHNYHTVIICSPLIDANLLRPVLDLLRRAQSCRMRVRILTRPDTAAAIESAGIDLKKVDSRCVRVVPSLHAKVYVALGRWPHPDIALITSANLTEGGVTTNRELGILIHAGGDREKELLDELGNYLRSLVCPFGKPA